MADVPKERIICERDEMNLVDKLNLEGIDKVFILHDLYSIELKNEIKKKVIEKIKEEEN